MTWNFLKFCFDSFSEWYSILQTCRTVPIQRSWSNRTLQSLPYCQKYPKFSWKRFLQVEIRSCFQFCCCCTFENFRFSVSFRITASECQQKIYCVLHNFRIMSATMTFQSFQPHWHSSYTILVGMLCQSINNVEAVLCFVFGIQTGTCIAVLCISFSKSVKLEMAMRNNGTSIKTIDAESTELTEVSWPGEIIRL